MNGGIEMAKRAYVLAPVDFGWELMDTVDERVCKLVSLERENFKNRECDFCDLTSVKIFLNNWEEAKGLATQAGWEGDVRFGNGPCVFDIPFSDGIETCFIFKQDNNGCTFVVSPVEMPWLDE